MLADGAMLNYACEAGEACKVGDSCTATLWQRQQLIRRQWQSLIADRQQALLKMKAFLA